MSEREASPPGDWQTMDTAPKDGYQVFLLGLDSDGDPQYWVSHWVDTVSGVGFWFKAGNEKITPLYWLRPDAPKDLQGDSYA